MLFPELNKLIYVVPFKGIPNALDYIPYSKLFYQAIEKFTYNEYGKSANLLDATRVMNYFGNVAYFHWFPDLFKTTKAELGRFYQPTFGLAAQSEFTDYLHGLTHIRSRSEHTFLGEAILIPDNIYFNGVGYGTLMNINADKSISECKQTLYEEFQLGKQKYSNKLLFKLHLISNTYYFQKEGNSHYKIYKNQYFKVDLPKTRVSLNYLDSASNPFEVRLAQNTVRAIYMDMKFHELSSIGKAFIHISPADSSKESCELIFTTETEDAWIKKIYTILHQANRKKQFQSIINTTNNKDDYAQQLATKTIKELYRIDLIA